MSKQVILEHLSFAIDNLNNSTSPEGSIITLSVDLASYKDIAKQQFEKIQKLEKSLKWALDVQDLLNKDTDFSIPLEEREIYLNRSKDLREIHKI